MGSNIIGQYKYILTNNAHELTPNRFEFKYDKNIIKNIFIYAKIWTWIFRMNDKHISQLWDTEA
jgi:hypothetical protein